jgi:hypothetical protein
MTPAKEKAKELVDKYKYNTRAWNETNGWQDCSYNAKQCALIAVDEILAEVPTEILDTYKGETHFIINDRYLFWQEVKQEIEKL